MKLPVITTALEAERARQASAYTDAAKAPHTAEVYRLLTALDAPITEALHAVNGRASSFAITLGSEVRAYARDVQAKLDNAGIPQADQVGTTATITPSGPTAKAYKYAAAATRITLLRGVKGAWYLTGIERVEVYPKQPGRCYVTISPAARDAVIRHAMAPFAVRAEAAP